MINIKPCTTGTNAKGGTPVAVIVRMALSFRNFQFCFSGKCRRIGTRQAAKCHYNK